MKITPLALAAAVLAITMAPTAASATTDVNGTAVKTWLVPNSIGSDTMPNSADPGIWPQPPSSGAPQCETYWVQVDSYQYDNQTTLDAIEALDDDGVLNNGEDHPLAPSWQFVQIPADSTLCAPVLPEQPADEVTYGGWSDVPNCDDRTTTATRTKTVTPFVLNEAGTEYVKGTPVETTETETREALEVECPTPPVIPEQPDSVLTLTDVDQFCEGGFLVTETTEVYTETVYDEETNTWVDTDPRIVESSSKAETTECATPPVTDTEPPTDSDPVVTPVASTPLEDRITVTSEARPLEVTPSAEGVLPNAGGAEILWALLGTAFLVSGAALLIGIRRANHRA